MPNIYAFTDTWNNAGTDFNAIKVSVTDTASGAGSKLLDLVKDTVSLFSVAKSGALAIAMGTLTANSPALNITQTWNNAAVAFSGLTLNVTNTASSASSKIFDLQIGGSSKLYMDPSGRLYGGGGYNAVLVHGVESYSTVTGYVVALLQRYQPFVSVGSAGGFIWSNSAAAASNGAGGQDLVLYRDAAGSLAQRAGTTAQTFNIYNTYTDVSNYERGGFRWNSNILEVRTDAAGTGSSRDLFLNPAGSLMFGTHSAIGAETITGFITIKDAAGNTRKLAVVS